MKITINYFEDDNAGDDDPPTIKYESYSVESAEENLGKLERVVEKREEAI
jgi:hypothetical protein